MLCDNQSVVEVVNSGYTKDRLLQDLLRQLVYIAATESFEVILRHISSKANRKSDILSRLHLGGQYASAFLQEFGNGSVRKEVNHSHFNTVFNW